jgi:type II secretory pathway pseudopilin PulG
MKARDRRSREEGFSLVELLIGTIAVIAALGAVITASLQISNLRTVDEDLNLAYIACMSNLEDLKSVVFEDLPGLHDTGFDVPAMNGEPGGLTPGPGDPDGLPGIFSITVEKSGGGVTLYRVVARVEWVRGGSRQAFQMETLMGPRDYK